MSEFYHSYNRGVEKRKVFLDGTDYARGVHDLYEFNDSNIVTNLKQRFNGRQRFNGSPTSIIPLVLGKSREKLVDLIVWCLMPNHYHLFSEPVVEGGLSKFHQKFGGGFTNFFNVKNKRSGVLFQGKYKKIQVTDDRQALQLICYIHSNPLDLWRPNWKERGLTNSEIQQALNFLVKEYRWSSHLDWWGIKNFPSLINTNSINRFFNSPKEYQEFFTNWLRYYTKDIASIKEFIFDK